MKIIRLLLPLIFSASAAKADPYVSRFTVSPIQSNNTILVSRTDPTVETISLDITRALSQYNPSKFEEVAMDVYIVYNLGNDEILRYEKIKSSDFLGAKCSKSFSVSIPANRVNGLLMVKYNFLSESGTLFSDNYAAISYRTTVAPPPPSTPYADDGKFYRHLPDEKIYVCIEGVWRHIMYESALERLFCPNQCFSNGCVGIDNHTETPPFSPGYILGAPILDDAELMLHTVTGKVYFREGNFMRWIASYDLKAKYRFNWNRLRPTDTITGYTIGPDLVY